LSAEETDALLEALRGADCGACGRSLKGQKTTHLVGLDKRAEWEHPVERTVSVPDTPRAIAVYCERCIAAGAEPKRVVIWDNGELHYRDVSTLQDLPPLPDPERPA
jgi:hypothetical protein